MSVNDAVLVNGARTPFGRFSGVLKDIPIVDLGVIPIKEVLRQCNVGLREVQEVYIGNCFCAEAESPSVIGRQVSLKAGIPAEVMSITLDTACCASLLAARLACQSIKYEGTEVAIAGGVESMSRGAFLIPPSIRWGNRLGNITIEDFMFGLGYKDYNPVSVDAGKVALEYKVDREEQDCWALKSQQHYAAAASEGKFKDEIVPVEVPQKKGTVIIDRDEQPRPNTTLEKLAELPTVFGSPTITAGNAPGLNDGATAVLLMSRKKAEEKGLEPLATVIAAHGRSTDPGYIATIPGLVIGDVLTKAGLTIDDIDLIEINEAFAAMPLVSSIILAGGDRAKAEKIREKINVNGGSVAIGHPIGASGARILMTLAYELKRRGGGYGVAAICGGLAQGEAMIIKV